MKHSPETPFLKDLFATFNKCKIKYSVLRNYETLPFSLNGSDVDILVADEFIDLALSVLQKTSDKWSGEKVVYYHVEAHINCFSGKDPQRWGAQIDLFPDLSFRGVPYFDTKSVLEIAELHNDIYVANADDASLISFIKEILANNKSRKNYMELAAQAFHNNPSRYEKIFRNHFGEKGQQSLTIFFTKPDTQILPTLASLLRRTLLSRSIKKHPLKTLGHKLNRTYQRFSRIFSPPGFTLAVLGTDGSGKSTIINHIIDGLDSALHGNVFYEHMRPNYVPSLAKLFGRSQTQETPTTNPHASKPSGTIGSFLRLAYYSIDYTLGYYLKVFNLMIRRPCLWIFDRYYYDYLIDPYRGRISLPKWVIKTVSLCIPKPNLILCLGADPAVIHQRKPELTLAEVERQVRDLKSFCKHTSRTVWIDTGCSIDQSVDQALEAITSAMASRYKENG